MKNNKKMSSCKDIEKKIEDRKRKIDAIINERQYKIRDFLCSEFASYVPTLSR
jgi:cupin superfamily acireductone dioxygenase involved in methionine salvage